MKKDIVINEAKSLLLSNPFDIAHDIFHHYKVWENILIIIIKENLSLDLEKLEIATWWHDYERGSSQHPTLENVMKKAGYKPDYILSVKNLINTHSFDDKHSDIKEAKVLFDADKIEYANSGRIIWVGEGIINCLLNPQPSRKYGQLLQKRIRKVVQLLHYSTSKQLMLNNVTNFISVLSKCQSRYGKFLIDVKEEELIKAKEYLQTDLR